MPPLLYLDTARLGQVSPSAKRALISALEFNQALGASAYFDELFFAGANSVKIANDFEGLAFWPGVEAFSSDIKKTLFASDSGETVFASRTSSLMHIAAKLLFSRCSKILVTDLNWQPFNEILSNAPNNSCCEIFTVDIKNSIFDDGATIDEIVELIATKFEVKQCNGIFLPAVCNLGVALPVVKIMDAIRKRAEIRFSVVDAAQAINHVSLRGVGESVDFTFGGTHKWLRSFEPMALGYFAKRGSRTFISETIERELKTNPISDSLMRITKSNAPQKSETVNLAPMFAAAGAIFDVRREAGNAGEENNPRVAVENIATQSGWKPMKIAGDLRSQILLLKNHRLHKASFGEIRQALIKNGVAASDSLGGICRISLPEIMDEKQLDHLRNALANVA